MSDQYRESPSYDEIALDGAQLYSDYFSGSGEYVISWSPSLPNWDLPLDTALVVGELNLSGDRTETLKTMCRHLFRNAGVRELSYVEHFNGRSPIWVMLVDNPCIVDLEVGVDVCRHAAWQWPIKTIIRRSAFPKRWLDPIFKLLIPSYPDCDLNCPLDQLILAEVVATDAVTQSASECSSIPGGRNDD